MLNGSLTHKRGQTLFTNSFGKGVKIAAGKLGSDAANSNSESAQTTLK